MQASANGTTYLRLSSESACGPPAAAAPALRHAASPPSRGSPVRPWRPTGCAAGRPAQPPCGRGGTASAAIRKDPAMPPRNTRPGAAEIQKISRQAVSLGVEEGCACSLVGELPGRRLDAVDVFGRPQADQRGGDQPQREQPLEDGRALAAVLGGQALGQVQRHHDADETAAHALQEPAGQKHRCIPARGRWWARWRRRGNRPGTSSICARKNRSAPATKEESMLPSSTAATISESCPAL